jgi:hypothetical protein
MRQTSARRIIRIAASLVLCVLAVSSCALRGGNGRGGDVLAELKAQFNADLAKPRLLVLVSPTCTACLGGAQWIQDSILQAEPDLDIHVYTVWYSMLPTDTPEAFPDARALMADPRVRHYWDSRRAVGAQFKKWVPSNVRGPIEWDAFYLYPAGESWTDAPPPHIVTGRTILETRRNLAAAIARLRS